MLGKLGYQKRDYHIHLTDTLVLTKILPIDYAFFAFWFHFFLLFVNVTMVVAAAIYSKLIFLIDEKNFTEKELAHTLFEMNYFKLNLWCKHQIRYYNFCFRKFIKLIWPCISGLMINNFMSHLSYW